MQSRAAPVAYGGSGNRAMMLHVFEHVVVRKLVPLEGNVLPGLSGKSTCSVGGLAEEERRQ